MPFRISGLSKGARSALAGIEILLVEDSRTYTAALKQRFDTEYGMKVTSCGTLEVLTAALAEKPGRFALALIDLVLPGAPSGEALDLVLSKGVPAIVFTASFSELRREQILAKHVADYVLKDGRDAIENVVKATLRLLTNRGAHVLLVDASPATRELLSEQLQRQLYRVTAVGDGTSALKALEQNNDFNMAIVGGLAPEMDGLALIEAIRHREEFDQLRIVGACSLEDRSLHARLLRAGANDVLNQPLLIEEFRWRVAQNIQTTIQVRKLRELASRDYLTGLYNRRYFFDNGPRIVAQTRKMGRGQAMAIIDIDHFKRLNDTYGHEIGDVVLKAVASHLDQICGANHMLSRLGGEEFGILISNCAASEARLFCESVRSSAELLPIKTDDGDLQVTVSIGLAEITEDESFDNYLNAADQFLYMAKNAGRNRVFSEADLDVSAVA